MNPRHALILPALAAFFAVTGCRDEKITTYRVPKEKAPPVAPADAATSALPPGHPSISPASTPPAAPTGGAASADAAMASTPVSTAAGNALSWTAPDHWISRPASAMRKATFVIPGPNAGEQAELAVTAFPGDVGGNLANVNRWRGQLQLPPITAAELGSTLQHLHVGSLHVDVADLLGPVPADGKPRQRVLGAIVPVDGSTWFFKLTGPEPLVTRERDAFIAFIQTLKPKS